MEKSYGAFDFVWPLTTTLYTVFKPRGILKLGRKKKINTLRLPHCIDFAWQKCIKSSNFYLISVTCK